jgi:menaquinone-dependent protoporphyrinogen oxidase
MENPSPVRTIPQRASHPGASCIRFGFFQRTFRGGRFALPVVMLSILVVYGTTHGHTAKIAAAVAKTIEASGASCDVMAAADGTHNPGDYDGVVVAASVHAGKYQKAVIAWVRAHRAVLDANPTAFISVCLGVLQKQQSVERDLNNILERFSTETGWRPEVTATVAGALPYTKYNWFIRWVMKRIAAKAGGDTDTSRDYEYTDWAALSRFSVQFARTVEARKATSSVCHRPASTGRLA